MLVICGWIYIKLKQTKSIDHFIWETCFLRYYFSEITVKSNRLVSIFQNNLFVSLSKGQFLNKHINDVTSAFKLKTTFEDRSILWFHKVHFFKKLIYLPFNNKACCRTRISLYSYQWIIKRRNPVKPIQIGWPKIQLKP